MQMMVELGRKQAELFEANNVAYCEVLITSYAPRQILLYVYHYLIRNNKIDPVEDMLQEQKEIAWRTARDLAKGRLGKNALIEVVKALLALEYFLNLKKN